MDRSAQMRKHGYVLAIVLIVAAIAGASIGYAQATARSRQAWEYTYASWNQMGDAGLQRFGAQGWELVTVATSAEGVDWVYFKRPK